ncbi:hypothetical protein AB595_18855 [Massilia sp. WF1]|uniref:hypothetical protein n=1 Tax=unclassified Massilia TaxID=2609279 RepID=UPI0006493313|nr:MULTISPECIES: hypothetical protein [unclassified Massilia]ALK95054.1 hypothetical protein AM586_00860 [Massilia sp. WG5]KLU35336.1 hypothetical protein AB595_18855 [Massilia sp. WF1]
MRNLSKSSLLLPLLLAGCTSADPGLRDTVILHYQHVANVHRIDFRTPVPLRRDDAIHFVQPLESRGFWAVFVLCSVDVTNPAVPAFYYDVDRFRVQFGGRRFGPLRPYTLRLDDTIDLNTRTDTGAIVDAIAAEIHEGPPSQVFRHGFYPNLDYRFAIYVSQDLSDYAGEELPLSYVGGHTRVLGNGTPPSDIPVAGANGTGITARCRP